MTKQQQTNKYDNNRKPEYEAWSPVDPLRHSILSRTFFGWGGVVVVVINRSHQEMSSFSKSTKFWHVILANFHSTQTQRKSCCSVEFFSLRSFGNQLMKCSGKWHMIVIKQICTLASCTKRYTLLCTKHCLFQLHQFSVANHCRKTM